MDKNQRWNNDQAWKRTQDVNVEKTTKQAIEKIAVAHLANGNTNEFMLGMTAISKLNAQNEIAELKGLVVQLLNASNNNDDG